MHPLQFDPKGPRRLCAACGATPEWDEMCVMSPDGEGPHEWIMTEPIPDAATLRLLEQVAIHAEQGGQEHD